MTTQPKANIRILEAQVLYERLDNNHRERKRLVRSFETAMLRARHYEDRAAGR